MSSRNLRHNRLLDSTVVTALPPMVAFLLFLYQAFRCCRDSRFFLDDPFITMRFAANLTQYGELSFNPGVVVEGYSNLLLVLIDAMLFRLGDHIPDAVTGIGNVVVVVLAASLLQLLVMLGLIRSSPHGGTERVAWYFALVLTAAGRPFAFWATAGLETPIEGLLYLCVALVATTVSKRVRLQHTLLGILFFGITLLLVTIGGGDWMPGFRMLIPVTPFAVYLAARLLLDAHVTVVPSLPRGFLALAFALLIPFVVRGAPLPGR